MDKHVVLGNDALQVLRNPAYITAMESLIHYIDKKAFACDPDDKEMAQRIILSKQIVKDFERELGRLIANAEAKDIEIQALEKRKTPIQRIFKR